MDEGGHLEVGGFGCASETDVDDDESHFGDSEVVVRVFPQAGPDVAAVVEEVDMGFGCVQVEGYVIGVAAEYICDLATRIDGIDRFATNRVQKHR